MSARKIKQLNLVDCSRKVICGRPVRVALVLTVKSQEGIAHTSNCIAASMKTMVNESSVLEENCNQHKKTDTISCSMIIPEAVIEPVNLPNQNIIG